jgi:hypothetical protein
VDPLPDVVPGRAAAQQRGDHAQGVAHLRWNDSCQTKSHDQNSGLFCPADRRRGTIFSSYTAQTCAVPRYTKITVQRISCIEESGQQYLVEDVPEPVLVEGVRVVDNVAVCEVLYARRAVVVRAADQGTC